MSSLKPLKLYIHGPTPNPWKVYIILVELGLPVELVEIPDVKGPEYVAINPNGRAPSLEDPNTGVTTWESGSNIEYLIETYDKENKLNYTSTPEKYWQNNWKHFQMSGQGPSYGQKAWFTRFHPEKVQSAIDRYSKEIDRILSVLDLHLARTGKQYLVGDRVSYVDLMFVTWNSMLPMIKGSDFDAEFKTKYPKAYEWHQKLVTRDSVKKMSEERAPYMKH